MKRALVYAAAIAALLSGGAMEATGSSAEPRLAHLAATGTADANQQEKRARTCRFQWLDEATWTAREERRTTDCVLHHWSVDGGESKFIAVGSCESGWNRFASNGGRYLGLFQHAATSWLGRVRSYMPERWRVGPWTRWRNSRSQIVTTARMVHAGGWSPWSCA